VWYVLFCCRMLGERAVLPSQSTTVNRGASLTLPEVHIGTPIPTCRETNAQLLSDGTGGYINEIFENLVFRYEEPNGMTRWDSPLFTVLWDDDAPPTDSIWDALIGSDGKGKVVRPNAATVLVRSRCLRPS
jgi:tRNA uridine 5-carbamoylmethylation protein Kti12